MQFNLEMDMECFTILSYSTENITIKHPFAKNGTAEREIDSLKEEIQSSFILSPKTLIKDWAPQTIQHLRKENLEDLLNLCPEVVLIGTGSKLQFPEPEIMSCFWDAQIGVEIMDTTAVCRTYNILVNEGRSTVAGLIIN